MFLSNCYHGFSKFLNCRAFWKIIDKKRNSKKNKENFQIFKNRNIWERTFLREYVYKISSRYLEKMTEFWYFVGNCHFSRCSLGFRYFPDFQTLSYLGRSKNVQGLFFAFWTKNWPKNTHHVAQTFSVWPFLVLVTLNDVDLEYARRKARMILASVPDTIQWSCLSNDPMIYVVVLTYFRFTRL